MLSLETETKSHAKRLMFMLTSYKQAKVPPDF